MHVLITGANGFVGKNLTQRLFAIRDCMDKTRPDLQINEIFLCTRETSPEALADFCARADFVVHLAGVNRPRNAEEFAAGNTGFTRMLLELLRKNGNRCPVLLASSIQASLTGRYAGSAYGQSKKAAEELLLSYSRETGTDGLIYRLPNLFGKWCRPNYNSVVATFCHNIAWELPITVSDPAAELELVYIDDLVDELLNAMEGRPHRTVGAYCTVSVSHAVTLGEIIRLLRGFHDQPRDAGCCRKFRRQLCKEAVQHLSVRSAAGENCVPAEDECGRARQLHRTAENSLLRSGLCEYFKARYHQGAALAQQQVGVLYGGRRARTDPGAKDRLG